MDPEEGTMDISDVGSTQSSEDSPIPDAEEITVYHVKERTGTSEVSDIRQIRY